MKRILMLIAFCIILPWPQASHAAEDGRRVLIYMVCGDLETDSGAATEDIREITTATKEMPALSVYLRVGGCRHYWFPQIEGGNDYILHIAGGEITVLEEIRESSISDDQALALFVDTYARDLDSLIFWGHGCPGFEGIGYDELHQNDTLTLPEISKALSASQKKLYIIGFDACSAASLEAVMSVVPFCDWFVASPENEALSGWNYTSILPQISNTMNSPLTIHSRTPLTVLNMNTYLESEHYISEVLQACFTSTGIHSLEEATMISNTLDARQHVSTFLDGQTLLLTSVDSDDAAIDNIGTEIAYSYQSFLKRK